MRVQFGEYELDTGTFRLMSNGHEVFVEPQVFDLLAYLIENRDRVVPKTELLDKVWGNRFVSESALTSRVKSARRAVGDDGAGQQVIRTQRGRGYQFVADVTPAFPDHGSEPAGPAPSSVGATVRVVPPPVSPDTIVGRAPEIAQVTDLLRAGNRLLTLQGPGGVGKTRLAQEVAARTAGAFAHGVHFVSLAEVQDAVLVPHHVAGSLGLHLDAEDDVDALHEALRGLELLLILDNFEHVRSAAPFVSRLVSGTDRLVVVTTSRERLRLVGEQCVDVAPLAFDTDTGDAVVLFERAARGASATFTLDESNRAAVVEVCRAVDGLPLGLELAAAETRVLTPALIVDRLRERRDRPRSDVSDRPDRHRTLRATIEWSVDTLDADQRRLFGECAVFVGPAPLSAVRAVFSDLDGDVVELLGDLVDKSLVRRSDGPGAQPWFSMLESIREVAAGILLASDDVVEVRRRHAREVASGLAELEDVRWGPASGYWIDLVATRWADIEAAYAWSRATGDRRLAADIAAPLYSYWHRVGQLAEAARWTAECLDDAPVLAPMTTAMLHLGAAYPHWSAERLRAARRHWEQGLDICRRNGTPRYISFCLSNLAGLAIGRPAEYDAGLAACRESLALAWQSGELPLIGHVLIVEGELTRAAGDSEAALSAYREAMGIMRRIDDRHGENVVLNNLAYLADQRGHHEEALRLGRLALSLAAETGQPMTAAFSMSAIAASECHLGRPERAARLVGAADAALRTRRAARHAGDRQAHHELLRELEEELGGSALHGLHDEGAGLSVVDATAYALGDADPFTRP
jgi:predicted ATPase/DNA-binding winged helix-turn-helix (wHTH) protein